MYLEQVWIYSTFGVLATLVGSGSFPLRLTGQNEGPQERGF